MRGARRSASRRSPRRAAPRVQVLIARGGHAAADADAAVDDAVNDDDDDGVAAQPRDLGLARHGFAFRSRHVRHAVAVVIVPVVVAVSPSLLHHFFLLLPLL